MAQNTDLQYLQEINLELNSNTAYTTVGAKQGDTSSRIIKIHVTENGEDWTIPAGVGISYRVRKPDGYAIWNEGIIDRDENVVYITLTEQTLAAAGRAYADIYFEVGVNEDRQILSTVSFIIIIMAAPDIVENIASSNEFSRILDLTNNADVILNEAEAWAVGEKGGVPVTEESFTYSVHGNSSLVVTINQDTFHTYVGRYPGQLVHYIFTCIESPTTEHPVGIWQVAYLNNIETDINLANYGISIVLGTPLASNFIEVDVTDPAIQYENNSKYYAEQAKESKEAIDNLTATGEKIFANDFNEETAYQIGDYVWYPPTTQSAESLLYRFIINHIAGNPWSTSEVVEEILIEKTTVDDITNFHFKMPQGPVGNVSFMTFDLNADTGELIMYTPDYMSPQVDFRLDNNDGNLYVEILN